jgi:hypothetical protein
MNIQYTTDLLCNLFILSQLVILFNTTDLLYNLFILSQLDILFNTTDLLYNLFSMTSWLKINKLQSKSVVLNSMTS